VDAAYRLVKEVGIGPAAHRATVLVMKKMIKSIERERRIDNKGRTLVVPVESAFDRFETTFVRSPVG